MKTHNFSAGPSILPQETIKNTAAALFNFADTGLSLMEVSHRSKEFVAVIEEAQQLFKELLDIPSGYAVLFLGGGASTQFCHIPYNLMKTKAAYLDTGAWANNALKEGRHFGEVIEVASSKDQTYSYIPKGFVVPSDVDYFHFTTNNTIYGTEIKEDKDYGVPLIADMSSDIFSRPVDVSKYTLIYGGAQKNLAPAGVTFVIVKEDALGKVSREIPTMIDYRTHISKGSMFNTPPVVPIFSALQTLKWLKGKGGLTKMQQLNEEKAAVLYDEIDRNRLFKGTVADHADRSLMNICFVMQDEYKDLEAEFFKMATTQGMSGIKGHRSVGGFRASTYNAMPKESIEALVACMKEFEAKH